MSTVLAEHIYQRLQRLVPGLDQIDGVLRSRGDGSRVLVLQVLEQTPYTTVLSLTQPALAGGVPVPDPEVKLRVYHDLEVAEPLSYRSRFGAREVYSCELDPRAAIEVKRELSFFLWKWLGQCLARGHHLAPEVEEAGL